VDFDPMLAAQADEVFRRDEPAASKSLFRALHLLLPRSPGLLGLRELPLPVCRLA